MSNSNEKPVKFQISEEEVEGEDGEMCDPTKGSVEVTVGTLNFSEGERKEREFLVRVYVQSTIPSQVEEFDVPGQHLTPPGEFVSGLTFNHRISLEVNNSLEDYLCFEVISMRKDDEDKSTRSCGWCFLPLKYVCHKSTFYVGKLMDEKHRTLNLTFMISAIGFGYDAKFQKWSKKKTEERVNKRRVKKKSRKKRRKKKKEVEKVEHEVVTEFDEDEFRRVILPRIARASFCHKCEKFVKVDRNQGVSHKCFEDCTNPLERPHRNRPLRSFQFLHRCDPTRGRWKRLNHDCDPIKAARGICDVCEERNRKGMTYAGLRIDPRLHAIRVGQDMMVFH